MTELDLLLVMFTFYVILVASNVASAGIFGMNQGNSWARGGQENLQRGAPVLPNGGDLGSSKRGEFQEYGDMRDQSNSRENIRVNEDPRYLGRNTKDESCGNGKCHSKSRRKTFNVILFMTEVNSFQELEALRNCSTLESVGFSLVAKLTALGENGEQYPSSVCKKKLKNKCKGLLDWSKNTMKMTTVFLSLKKEETIQNENGKMEENNKYYEYQINFQNKKSLFNPSIVGSIYMSSRKEVKNGRPAGNTEDDEVIIRDMYNEGGGAQRPVNAKKLPYVQKYPKENYDRASYDSTLLDNTGKDNNYPTSKYPDANIANQQMYGTDGYNGRENYGPYIETLDSNDHRKAPYITIDQEKDINYPHMQNVLPPDDDRENRKVLSEPYVFNSGRKDHKPLNGPQHSASNNANPYTITKQKAGGNNAQQDVKKKPEEGTDYGRGKFVPAEDLPPLKKVKSVDQADIPVFMIYPPPKTFNDINKRYHKRSLLDGIINAHKTKRGIVVDDESEHVFTKHCNNCSTSTFKYGEEPPGGQMGYNDRYSGIPQRASSNWDLFGMLSAFKNSFFSDILNPFYGDKKSAQDEEAGLDTNNIGKEVLDPSIVDLVCQTISEAQKQSEKCEDTGFLLVVQGLRLYDIKDPNSELMQSIVHAKGSTDPTKTLIVVMGTCPSCEKDFGYVDERSIPIGDYLEPRGDRRVRGGSGRKRKDEEGQIPLYTTGPGHHHFCKAKTVFDVIAVIKDIIQDNPTTKRRVWRSVRNDNEPKLYSMVRTDEETPEEDEEESHADVDIAGKALKVRPNEKGQSIINNAPVIYIHSAFLVISALILIV